MHKFAGRDVPTSRNQLGEARLITSKSTNSKATDNNNRLSENTVSAVHDPRLEEDET